MAKISNLPIQISGRVGDIVYYRRNGKVYMRQRPRPTMPGHSEASMRFLTSMANTAHLWRAFPRYWCPVFNGRRSELTNYNAFVGANYHTTHIYLSRPMARDGAAVVTPVAVSHGVLPTIGITLADGVAITNIALGPLVPTPSTTVGRLASEIIGRNKGYQPGDTLLFMLLLQQLDSFDQRPFCTSLVARLPLAPASSMPLGRMVYDSIGFAAHEGRLASSALPLGGMTWVHTRPRPGGEEEQVSTQSLVTNNAEMIAHYSSDEAFRLAVDSYGGIRPAQYITPGND